MSEPLHPHPADAIVPRRPISAHRRELPILRHVARAREMRHRCTRIRPRRSVPTPDSSRSRTSPPHSSFSTSSTSTIRAAISRVPPGSGSAMRSATRGSPAAHPVLPPARRGEHLGGGRILDPGDAQRHGQRLLHQSAVVRRHLRVHVLLLSPTPDGPACRRSGRTAHDAPDGCGVRGGNDQC